MRIMGEQLTMQPFLAVLKLNILQKKLKKLTDNKYLIKNIYRIQVWDSIVCGYFCIGYIYFMLKGKSFLDYTNLFSPKKYEKNDRVILKSFQWPKRLRWKKSIVFFLVSIENLKIVEYYTFSKKH